MIKVLCFGDSNTYGFIPQSASRYDENTRWSAILKNSLKSEFEIIENGCNNRTCFMENKEGIKYTGIKFLPLILDETFDIVILSLGINDLQKIYRPDYKTIKKGINETIKVIAQKAPRAKIVLLSPSKLNKNVLEGYFSSLFDEVSIEQSRDLEEIIENASIKNGCYFVDLEKIAKVSTDGLHYCVEGHKKIAQFMIKLMSELMGELIP